MTNESVHYIPIVKTTFLVNIIDDMKLLEMASREYYSKEYVQRNKTHTKSISEQKTCPSHSKIFHSDNFATSHSEILAINTPKYNTSQPSLKHSILSMTSPARSTRKRTQRGWPHQHNGDRIPSSVSSAWAVGPGLVMGLLLVIVGRMPVTAQYTEAGAWEGLENNTAVNVSSQLATTAFLPCAVRMIGDKQISWIRKRDWHVLTSGLQTFTNDARFSVTHKDGADDWTLTIKFLQKRDNGTYECQISTASGIVSQFVHLHVIIPEAFILGNSEYHVQTGSSINLFCIIEQSPIPPQFVSWKHNERLLNYDKYRGGVTVHTEHGPKTSSRLLISGATIADSGNYTCGAPNTESATVHVFVSQGDKTAAIQRRTSAAPSPLAPPLFMAALPAALCLQASYSRRFVLL